eukprot:g7618.t1
MGGPEPLIAASRDDKGLTGVPKLLAGAAAGYVAGLVKVIAVDVLIWTAGGVAFACHWLWKKKNAAFST